MLRPRNFDPAVHDWKKSLPRPVFDERPEYLELYDRAWEFAHDHIYTTPGLPQTPYMDEAFTNTDIWIWDTCFMMFFCKYAPDVFPGIESLNNFYRTLLDGKPLPMVAADSDFHGPVGSKVQMCVHIPDNPPLFAWAEYSYALMTGDRSHLEKLLLDHRYLQKYFAMFESFEPGWQTAYTRAPVCLKKHADGYFWEGGRSGMDNTPRGRTAPHADKDRPNNPDLLWIDAISQQCLAAKSIAACFRLIGRPADAEKWDGTAALFADKVDSLYWDDADGMYYDILASDRSFLKCLTPASFWPLLAGIPSPDRVERMCRYLTDPRKLGGDVPWTTVSRDDSDYHADGSYWRGSVWLPTAYMGIKGLEKYGRIDLARDCSRRILEHMYQTYRNVSPHTIWECYNPEQPLPATLCDGTGRVRPNFCGWSALGPISLFLENIIGIRSADAFAKRVVWDLPVVTKGLTGVRNYSFGCVTADLLFDGTTIFTTSDQPFTLVVAGRTLSIPAGSSSFPVK